MKLPAFLASLSLLAVATLTGCPSPNDDARFADATEVQIERSYTAASGRDLGDMLLIGTIFSGTPTNSASCPSIVTSGQDTTVSGGCTDGDGAHYEGTIVTHNGQGFIIPNPAYDKTEPTTVTYNAFEIKADTDHVILDGVVSMDPVAREVDGDMTLTAQEIESQERITLTCNAANLCTAVDSEIALSDLGGATVEGSWSLGETPTGTITLHGADDLVFQQGSIDADGCVPYAVGSKTGKVCMDSEEGDGPQGFARPGPAKLPVWAMKLVPTLHQ
jgi:hypothetical protein